MRTVCLSAVLICIQQACAPENPSGKVINPNGDSELALLMRDMYDDGMRTKQQILNGEIPEVKCDYTHIFHADATEPEKVASTDYTLYGKAYQASVERLLNAGEEERVEAYQTMVGACMNCHQAMCPGPMVKIRHMYLSDSQLERLDQQDEPAQPGIIE